MVWATMNRRKEKMQANRWQFRLLCRCGGKTQCTLPDEAHPGLHLKPLDAAIGRVALPSCPGSLHGQQIG
jgi:hypothetical protein